jgi:hypothetical protein
LPFCFSFSKPNFTGSELIGKENHSNRFCWRFCNIDHLINWYRVCSNWNDSEHFIQNCPFLQKFPYCECMYIHTFVQRVLSNSKMSNFKLQTSRIVPTTLNKPKLEPIQRSRLTTPGAAWCVFKTLYFLLF